MRPTNRSALFSTAALFPRAAFLDGDDAGTDEPDAPAVDAAADADTPAYEIPTVTADDGTVALDFAGFDDEALAELERAALAAFAEHSVQNPDDDQLADLAQIADDVEAIRGELSARSEAAAARQAQVDALAARVGVTDDAGEPDDAAQADDAAATDDAAPADDAAADGQVDEPATAQTARRPITTRMRTATLSPGANQVPASASVVDRSAAVMVASGTDAAFTAAHDPVALDLLSLGDIVRRDVAGGRLGRRYLARVTQDEVPDSLMFDGSTGDIAKWEALLASRDIDTLTEQGAMVASGCGPAETIYDHIDDTALGNLVDVPERVFTRGSMEFPENIDLRDFVDQIAGNGGWDDGDAAKAVISINCPTYRAPLEITARYLRLKFTNLRARSNPEVYADVVRKMMKAHEINKHLDTVLDIVAGNGGATAIAVDMTHDGTNPNVLYQDHAAGALLTQIELLVESARSRWMLGNSAAVELLAPRWVRGAVRASLARKRSDQVYNVSDAEIDAWFRTRGVRPQFLDYWQHIPGDFANANIRAFPQACELVLYPANSVVRGTQGTLDLGSEIRDSSLNAENAYELFTEEFYETGFALHEPVIATVATVANGVTHGDVAAVNGAVTAQAHDARGNFDLA